MCNPFLPAAGSGKRRVYGTWGGPIAMERKVPPEIAGNIGEYASNRLVYNVFLNVKQT
jgi:hypothetical protein